MVRIICLLIGYCFGLFQTSYIYGRLHGIDIRNYGSGNAGTTNALRTLGTKAGVITFFGDCFKCVFCGSAGTPAVRKNISGYDPSAGGLRGGRNDSRT